MAEIDWFEVNSYGNVKIRPRRTNYDRPETTYEYYGVPPKVIRKLIDASSSPDVKDFEKWIDDAKPKGDSTNAVQVSTFWDHR